LELTRERIERKDFPQVRRGLDPEAVQDHLHEVAKAVDEVKHGGTAAATGAWVTAIVDAAERAAQELEQTARAEAERMRSSAKAAAETTLARAKNEAESTLSSAKAQAEKTLTSANASAHQTLSSAKAESESTLTNARTEAASSLSSARAEAKSTLTSARDEAERCLSSAKAEAEKTLTSANSNAHQTLTSAKSESQRMLASARTEADAILSSARAEAASTRSNSRAQAQQHLERVEQSVARLLDRANAVQGDLGKLVADASGSISKLADTVRCGADKLRADLDVPREERPPAAPAASALAAPVRPAAPAAAPPATPAAAMPPSPATADPPRVEQGAAEAEPAPQPETQRRLTGSPAPPAAPAAGNGTSGMQPPAVGPRLEAFNMAMSGASRDEVARHLKEKRRRRWLTACLAYIACSVGCLAASLALRGIDYRWDNWTVIAICTVMGGGFSGWMLMTVVETRREDR